MTGGKPKLAPEDRAFLLRAALVFLAAFAVRAVFISQWVRLPYLGALCADAWAYDKWALEILNGQFIRHTAFYQSPLYPYFLAGFYKLFGHQPAGVLWLQGLVDSLTCVIVMRIAWRCFSARAGLIAGLLCAFYRPFIFSAGLIGKETFAVFGVALFTLLALRAGEGGRGRGYFLCGLAAGGCALLRTNALLLLPAALLWFWLRRDIAGGARRFFAAAALPLLLGCAAALLPAALHNFAASRDLVLTNYNGGYTFFLGNNPAATGAGIYPAGLTPDPLLEESQPARIAEAAAGRPLKPSEISAYWFRRGLAFIAGDPVGWLVLTAAKFTFFWNWYEIPDNYDIQFVSGHFNTLLKFPLAAFGLIGCFGAAGLFFCRARERSGLPLFLFLAYLASVLPFWLTDRYRLPALVFLLPLAAAAADKLAEAAVSRGWGRIWKPFLAAAPLMLLCLGRPDFDLKFAEAAGWGQLVAVHSERGEHAKALEAFRNAAALNPESLGPEIISKAAFSLAGLGRTDEALELYAAGSSAHPASADLYNNRGVLLLKLGKTREGVAMLERAEKIDPDLGAGYRNLFYGYARLGRKADALRCGQKAAALFPGDLRLKRDVQALK